MRNSSFLEEQKDMLKRKKMRLELRDSNPETFHGIFAIKDVDRSTKPVDVVLIMLHINCSI